MRHVWTNIADEGKGVTKNSSLGSKGNACVGSGGSGYHQGMVGMRERAALLGGRVTFDSVRGRGTRVDVDIPLPESIAE